MLVRLHGGSTLTQPNVLASLHTAASKENMALRILITAQSFELQMSHIENRMCKYIGAKVFAAKPSSA